MSLRCCPGACVWVAQDVMKRDALRMRGDGQWGGVMSLPVDICIGPHQNHTPMPTHTRARAHTHTHIHTHTHTHTHTHIHVACRKTMRCCCPPPPPLPPSCRPCTHADYARTPPQRETRHALLCSFLFSFLFFTGPTVFASVKKNDGVDEVMALILDTLATHTGHQPDATPDS